MNIVYSWLDAAAAAQAQEALFNVMDACVAEGASIGFVSNAAEPMQRFWQKTVNSVANGEKALLVALVRRGAGGHRSAGAGYASQRCAPRRNRQIAGASGRAAQRHCPRAVATGRSAGRAAWTAATGAGYAHRRCRRAALSATGLAGGGADPDYAQSVAGAFDATTVMFKTLPQR